MYVPCEASGSVTILNGTSVVANVSVGGDPYQAVYDSLHGLVFVGHGVSSYNFTSVLNGTSLVETIRAGGGEGPTYPVYDPENGLTYLPNGIDGNITVMNGTRRAGSVNVGGNPWTGVADASNGYVYITNTFESAINVISGTTLLRTVPVGNSPQFPAYDPLHDYIYVPNLNSFNVSVLRGTSVIANPGGGGYPESAVYDPANGEVYVIDNSHSVTILHGTALVATVQAGPRPGWGVYSNRSGDVFVASTAYPPGGADTNTTVYNGTTEVASVNVGARPAMPGFDPSNGYVYVPNFASNNVSIIGPASSLTLSSVNVSPSSVSLSVGGAQTFTASPACAGGPCPSGTTYAWSMNRALGSFNSTTGSVVKFTAGASSGTAYLFTNATLNGVVLQSGAAAIAVLPPLVPGSWTQLSPLTPPSPRDDASMTYDAADGYVLLFGGITSRHVWNGVVNDTWAFQNGTWTNLSGPSSNAPCPRARAPMIYDVRDGYVLLVGGWDGGNVPGCTIYHLNDTWGYRAGRWFRLPGTVPVGDYSGLMAYDAADGYPIYFGGNNSNSTFKYVGGNWVLLHPTTSPAGIQWLTWMATMTYDATAREVLLFGKAHTPGGNQTWAFSGGNWTPITPYSVPPQGGGRVGSLSDFASGGYGLLAESPSPFYSSPTTTWGIAGGVWVNLSRGPAPSPRSDMASVYDPSLNASILFGGEGPTARLNDTWMYSMTAPASPVISSFTASPSPLTLGYGAQLSVVVSGGFGPLRYAYAGLPPGCVTRSSSSWICTPTAPGSFVIRAYVNDSAFHSAMATVALLVVTGGGPLARYTITFSIVSPGGICPSILFNGTTQADGSQFSFLAGTYIAQAFPCSGSSFSNWTYAQGAVVYQTVYAASASITLVANGTLSVDYILAAGALTVNLSANATSTLVSRPVTLTPSVSHGMPPYSCLWALNGTNTTLTGCLPFSLSWGHPGTYTYEVWARDANGTAVPSNPVALTVSALPVGPSKLVAFANYTLVSSSGGASCTCQPSTPFVANYSFRGSVRGGVAPYLFTWTAEPTGPSRSGQNVSLVLTDFCGVVSLEVTDARGAHAFANESIYCSDAVCARPACAGPYPMLYVLVATLATAVLLAIVAVVLLRRSWRERPPPNVPAPASGDAPPEPNQDLQPTTTSRV